MAETKALGTLAQVLDSAFPSGMFIHSFGIEAHIKQGKVESAADLELFLKNIITDQYQRLEFQTAKSVYNYAAAEALLPIIRADFAFSSMLTFPYAKAYKTIGENILSHIKSLEPNQAVTKRYFAAACEKKTPCNEIVLLSIFACDLCIDIKLFLALWSKRSLGALGLCALKISKIKPSEVQRMLFGMDGFLDEALDEALKRSGAMNFNPFFDETAYKHKSLESKMFAT
ncbi:MAG: urease [Campylobacteraceae bacterium]|jgi:urease accessory protein|nr:urease [Campylobacteraceae bacterium]